MFRLPPAPINIELDTESFQNYKLFHDFKVCYKTKPQKQAQSPKTFISLILRI